MLQDRLAMQKPGITKYWLQVLDEYDVQFLALDRHSDSRLIELFQSQPGWVVDFEDEEAVLFARAGDARRVV